MTHDPVLVITVVYVSIQEGCRENESPAFLPSVWPENLNEPFRILLKSICKLLLGSLESILLRVAGNDFRNQKQKRKRKRYFLKMETVETVQPFKFLGHEIVARASPVRDPTKQIVL